jgi:hypothetical protein
MIFHSEKPTLKAGGEMPDSRVSYDYVYHEETKKINKRTVESYEAKHHPEDQYKRMVVNSEKVELKDLPEEARAKLEALLNPSPVSPTLKTDLPVPAPTQVEAGA